MSRAGEILEKLAGVRRVMSWRGGRRHKITKCPPGKKVMGHNHCVPMSSVERIKRSRGARYASLRRDNNQYAISRDRAVSMRRRTHAGY